MERLKQKLKRFGKPIKFLFVLFVLMFLLAYSNEKTWACVVAFIEILLVLIVILLQKDIIKTSKNKLYIIPLVLSLILIIPYGKTYNINYYDAEKIEWSDFILSNVLPEPESLLCETINNTEKNLTLYVYKTTLTQYNNYINKCKKNGFTIDIEQYNSSFYAYNSDGYKLYLYYYENEKKMTISVDSPIQLQMLDWPNTGLTRLIPIPESTLGKIEANDETNFIVYLGKMSKESMKNYINLCKEKGFSAEVNEGDTFYSAQNNEGYKINIEYIGNNTIKVSIKKNENETNLSNNGDTELNNNKDSNYNTENETENTNSNEINQSQIEEKDNILTIDNCPELANILTNNHVSNQEYIEFFNKYEDRIIEFDGNVSYIAPFEDYETRYDLLISYGNFDANHQIGPTFKIENVNSFDLGLSAYRLIDELPIGANIHIKSKLTLFDSNTSIFYLKPIDFNRR